MSLFRSCIVGAMLLMSGCGFKPLYQNNTATTAELGSISVPVLTGAFGYTLTKELRILLPQTQSDQVSQYQLRLVPDVQQTGLAIEQDDSVTRYNVRTQVVFELIDAKTGDVVLTDVVRNLTSYNAITSQYSTLIAEKEALRRSAHGLAQRIYQKLYIALNP